TELVVMPRSYLAFAVGEGEKVAAWGVSEFHAFQVGVRFCGFAAKRVVEVTGNIVDLIGIAGDASGVEYVAHSLNAGVGVGAGAEAVQVVISAGNGDAVRISAVGGAVEGIVDCALDLAVGAVCRNEQALAVKPIRNAGSPGICC